MDETPPPPRRAPWLEIGVAVGIVAMLATALGVTLWVQNSMRRERAWRDLEQLATACEMYVTCGGLPPPLDVNVSGNREVYRALTSPWAEGPHLVGWPERRLNATGSMIDPWGTPYQFELILEMYPYPNLVVYSCGPNRINESYGYANRIDREASGDDLVWDCGLVPLPLSSGRPILPK